MKICLAGTYAITQNNRKYIEKVDYMLESFYYISEWQIPFIKQKKLFLLDSGAFTFLNNQKKGNIDWKKYIDRYIDFINKYDVKYFFELDIDGILGYDNVKKIREYIESKTHKKSIPVWHKSRGLEEWKNLVKEYDYVAIGGIVTKEIKSNEYKYFNALLKIAKENKCKVHGLGFTGLKQIPKYKFYSVDSTSWKSGSRFGTLYNFKNDTLIQIKKPNGCRAKSKGGWYEKVELLNLEEWIKFQKYAEKKL